MATLLRQGGRHCLSDEVAHLRAARSREVDVAYLRAARALGATRAIEAAWLRSVARRPQTAASRRSARFRIRRRALCLAAMGGAGPRFQVPGYGNCEYRGAV